jgi:3-methyl-2-oxobutanoate hydroxymethyltransferase
MARVTINHIRDKKARGERIAMLTAYDYITARLLDEAGVDLLLVGDSLGNTVLGYENTLPVTLEEMLHHTRAVVRGTKRALVVGDLPFMTYQLSEEQALTTAGRFLKETGCQAVKLEGGVRSASAVKRLVEAGIPVMGHIGLTPQSIHQLGGFKVQGKTPKAAVGLLHDAKALEEAGAFAVVLECVPTRLARTITDRLQIPTIGIGAGPDCDGQVQVLADILGFFDDFVPKHARRYANLGQAIRDAAQEYIADVRSQAFPSAKESFTVDVAVFATLEEEAGEPLPVTH